MIQVFLAQSPRDPLADEASLALVGAFLELEDFESVVRLSRRFAKLYPKSTYLDSFQYSEALGDFHLGQYDRAIEVAETIAAATYKDAERRGSAQPEQVAGPLHPGPDLRCPTEPARALDYYRQVADRFTDAAGAIKSLTRKELKLPEVSVIRPAAPAVAAAGAGLRAIAVQQAGGENEPKDGPAAAKLEYRNIAEADVKVYPVDLMQLYLTRRNLNGIAGIDLAGITPFHSATIRLGDGQTSTTRSAPSTCPWSGKGPTS